MPGDHDVSQVREAREPSDEPGLQSGVQLQLACATSGRLYKGGIELKTS